MITNLRVRFFVFFFNSVSFLTSTDFFFFFFLEQYPILTLEDAMSPKYVRNIEMVGIEIS